MIIGVPKEIKPQEYRVSMTPDGVSTLTQAGHTVLVQAGAGIGSGFQDDEYRKAGAEMADSTSIYMRADLVVKVKEPLEGEFDALRTGSTLFTYLHLAPNRPLTELLLTKKITALGYETLERNGKLPLLQPMSEIAGRMAPLIGAYYLQKPRGGTGVLPCGVAGVRPAKAVIIGAGTVGANAAGVALGIGMDTVVLNRSRERLADIDQSYRGMIRTVLLSQSALENELSTADVVIGALYVRGGRTPVLIARRMLAGMKRGAVIVDVSIDQGGCAETSQPRTHDDPVYMVDDVIHYMVANMPGAYPRTSTLALTQETLPYIKMIASNGIKKALEDGILRTALNTRNGEIVHKGLIRSMQ
ncbi:MAG TPA: alanine dehydrogenase [Dissulfurispiraceae bacterium]|nr:alanine dehydrogenase [Dissulfurispiraceae bacterium]